MNHAQLHTYLYAILFFFGLVYAAVRGGAPERVGAAIIFVGNILTILVASPWHTHFDRVEVGMALVDGLVLIALIVLMMKANRVWPVWMTSVQGLGFLSHIPILLGPLVVPQAYTILQGMGGWPIMALLIGGNPLPSIADQAERDRRLLAELLAPVLGPSSSAAAEELLRRHVTLAAVLSATDSAREDDPATRHLRAIREALHRASRAAIEDRPVMQAYAATIDYLMLTMGQLDVEQLRVLFLNPRNVLIADEVMARGTIDAAPIYPREILKRALDLGATALILAHNHPSGDPKPSAADIEATHTIVEGGRALGIVLHDHLILSRSGWVSLRAEGLLDEQGNARA